eukprot:GGOE01061738.1.p2 GENE.GGOE01061738.1~~GGOE01061738.1.p2  ORF type:complete len:385 (+),score=87.51 GGOE01061738.1:39-1193(+)
MHQYKVVKHIGEGNFGRVLQAIHVETKEAVAIKLVSVQRLQDGFPNNVLREVKALQLLQHHPNVVKLYEVFPHGSNIAMVMGLMRTDLAVVIQSRKSVLPEGATKSYLLMLLRGIKHCHANGVIHRDIKPGNCLIGADGQLKLGDFGLARLFHNDGRPMTHEVATRWYRAPELLFGDRQYGPAVDMWAAGCVFAEMLLGMPLFPGDGDIGQMNKIFQLLGTPDEITWPNIQMLPDWNKVCFTKIEGLPLEEVFCNSSAAAVGLLRRILVCDPAQRLTASAALEEPYFLAEPLPMQPDLFAELMECKSPLVELVQPKALAKPWQYKDFLEAPFVWPVSPPHSSSSDNDDGWNSEDSIPVQREEGAQSDTFEGGEGGELWAAFDGA